MITFTRGLVLRRGERSFEFERDLGDGQIQFKFQDTYEVRTFTLGKLYRDILSGEVRVVHQNLDRSSAPATLQDQVHAPAALPSSLGPAQEALIAFRMHYVWAAQRMGVPTGSLARCRELLVVTDRPRELAGVDDATLRRMKTPKPSTLRRWLKLYERSSANPFALCDQRQFCAKPRRLSRLQEDLIDDAISRHYMQLRGASRRETWRQIALMIANINRRDGTAIPVPSMPTVARRIAEIAPFVQDSTRYGVAFARNKWRYSLKGDQSTRILERAEVDHTLLDLWVLDPRSGLPLGRPWVTAVIDRMSGYLLGIYISFYGPSVATVANALKVAILPKENLLAEQDGQVINWTAMGIAESYVVDNGLEFHSQTFRRIAWALRSDLIYNPVRHPWLKSSIERVMMELNRDLPARGKVLTPIKNAVAPSPDKSACILFDDLCANLIYWAGHVHARSVHPKTLVRPADLWEEGRASGPPPILPTDLKELELATGISAQRTVGGDGVFFQYLRYNSPELQDYCRSHGRSFATEIRFNPDDLGYMHVHLPKSNQWLAVPLQRPWGYGEGLSLIQHQINRAEAGKRLREANAEEELLRARERVAERWNEAIRRGSRIRKNADLLRHQNLTSARLTRRNEIERELVPVLPENSQMSLQALESVLPFPSFSLQDES